MRLGVYIAAFSIYCLLSPADFINGDAVVYAEQIRDANFSERATHVAYYVLAYPLTWLPVSLDRALNLLNCAFGAGVVLLVGMIGEAVFKSRVVGLVASGIAFANSIIAYNALHAEVYIAQTFFLLLAMYLWLTRRQSFVVAIAAAVAVLISASSVLAAPFFVIMRPKWRPIAIVAVFGAGIVAVTLAPVFENYLFGARGLLSAVGKSVDYPTALLKTGQDIFFGYFAMLPFLIAGAIVCWRTNQRFLVAIAVLWIVTFIGGEKFIDVPVQLATYAVASPLAALGVSQFKNRYAFVAALVVPLIAAVSPYVPADYADHLPSTLELTVFAIVVVLAGFLGRRAFIAAFAANSFIVVGGALEAQRQLESFRQLAAEIDRSDRPVVVGNWNELVRMTWILHGKAYHPDSVLLEDFDPSAFAGRKIWKIPKADIASRPRKAELWSRSAVTGG